MKHNFLYSKSWLFGLLIGAIAFTSCQKDDFHIFKDKGGRFGNPLVLVAGYESNGVNDVAKYWVDGQEVTLSDGKNDASANSIFVAGIDIYVAGKDGGPVYWKNNTEIALPANSYASANSIYVSGGHVYVAGTDGSSAVYWKDGTEIILNTTDTYGNYDYSGAFSVFISANDIYVSGFHGPNAVYWKNNEEVYISSNGAVGSASIYANSLYVAGGNVYVVGSEYIVGGPAFFGKYWKNGIDETATLNHPNFESIGSNSSVFVSGNKVYISGTGLNSDPEAVYNITYSAAFWNNGNMTVLPSNGTQSFTSDIYVRGNDVFVSGSEWNNSQTYAVYWKNGAEVYLTDGTRNANATSIFIK